MYTHNANVIFPKIKYDNKLYICATVSTYSFFVLTRTFSLKHVIFLEKEKELIWQCIWAILYDNNAYKQSYLCSFSWSLSSITHGFYSNALMIFFVVSASHLWVFRHLHWNCGNLLELLKGLSCHGQRQERPLLQTCLEHKVGTSSPVPLGPPALYRHVGSLGIPFHSLRLQSFTSSPSFFWILRLFHRLQSFKKNFKK